MKSFIFSQRNLLLTCLAAFYPVRLAPLAQLTVKQVENPFVSTDTKKVIRIRGTDLTGKTDF